MKIGVWIVVLWLSYVVEFRALAQGTQGTSRSLQAQAETVRASGTVQGTVTFLGEIPKSPIADDAGVRRELLHVSPKNRGLRNVVVWLIAEQRGAEVRRPPATLPVVTIDQRDHEFVPRVLAVRFGQPVKFTNSDPANHNVRTSSPQSSNEFNVFTGVDGSYTHRFAADPQQHPVRLGCDIHPWMRGWIYVFEHSYFSVTDERGRFHIAAVPAGRYKLALKQPDVNYAHERIITVSDKQPTSAEIEIRAGSLPKPKE